MDNKVSGRLLGSWMAVAMSGPFVYIAGRQNWLTLLLVALLCMLLDGLVFRQSGAGPKKCRLYCAAQGIFLCLALLYTAHWSSQLWPTAKQTTAVPLTLLALGAFSACKGPANTARGTGALFWIVLILYGILLAFGIRNIELDRLGPKWQLPDGPVIFACLLPCVFSFLPRQEKMGRGFLPAVFAGGLAMTLFVQGSLTADIGKNLTWPFYTAGQSVHISGAANRLEAIISVGATLGFYGLYSLLLSAVGALADKLRQGWRNTGIVSASVVVGIGVMLSVRPPERVLTTGALFLWVAVPFLRRLPLKKRSEKGKKPLDNMDRFC